MLRAFLASGKSLTIRNVPYLIQFGRNLRVATIIGGIYNARFGSCPVVIIPMRVYDTRRGAGSDRENHDSQ